MPFDPKEYIPVAEAAQRLPSSRAGKKTHISTVYRLITKHNLPCVRRGRWRFVKWQSILDLYERERRFDPEGRFAHGLNGVAR